MDSSSIFKWLNRDQFSQIFSYTIKEIIQYIEAKAGEERTNDWVKEVDYKGRAETTKVRRLDKYLKNQLNKAEKTYESDEQFVISREEIYWLIGVI